MIVVCTCGQKLRIRKLARADDTRCPKCRRMTGDEVHRQAARNADAVLEIAAVLFAKPEHTWTKEEVVIARILHAHETAVRS